jgi:hypothetical protein
MEETQTVETPLEHEDDTQQQHQLWVDALTTIAAKAYERLPQLEPSIRQAYSLVIGGHVEEMGHGAYRVATLLHRGKKWWLVNDTCDCPAYADAIEHLCTHRLAVMLLKRAKTLLATHAPGCTPPAPQGEQPAETPDDRPQIPALTVPPRFLVDIQGTTAVRFGGLLLMAHERGLVSLEADWTYNDAELSLAHATAIFSDGRKFEESGDAAPSSVGKKVATHWRRVALTRAKARALRDALSVDIVAVEELAD